MKKKKRIVFLQGELSRADKRLMTMRDDLFASRRKQAELENENKILRASLKILGFTSFDTFDDKTDRNE